jgi:hypothetical protein
MPVRGSAIGAMKRGIGGVSAAVSRQPAPPGTGSTNPGRNSFGPRPGRNPSAPSIGAAGGYSLRQRVSGGGRYSTTVKWLMALVLIEVAGGEVLHRAYRHYYGS